MSIPPFSIVIPMYNRQREIRRAVESCLAQDFTDFELIVVDDASQDGSIAAVSSYSDPRIKLVRHEQNRGQCPARNTGVAAGRGEWVVFLDSDHSLKPNGLSIMRHYIECEQENVDRLGFMFDWDTGIFSPDPAPDGSVLDYEGWMRFAQTARVSDTLPCTRRSTFGYVPLTDSSAAETEYHLDFARRFKTRLIPEVVATEYTDAANRLTASRVRPARERILLRACDDLASMKRMLHTHGAALRRHAPRVHEVICRRLVLASFIRREWLSGLHHACGYFGSSQLTLNGVASIVVAAIWPEAYSAVRDWKAQHAQWQFSPTARRHAGGRDTR